jgi:hypothetical protein
MPGKVQKVMHEFKGGELHSGSKHGPKVTNRAQAIAIGLSEARAAGEHVKPMTHVAPDMSAKHNYLGHFRKAENINAGHNTITGTPGSFHVVSEHGGKNLGGPYRSKSQAVKRLRQVEYFKHHKG